MNARTQIVTDYWQKPGPLRHLDWSACREDYEPADSDGIGGCPIGYGRTEDEALADLLVLEDEREDA